MKTEFHDRAAALCRNPVSAPSLSGQEGEAARGPRPRNLHRPARHPDGIELVMVNGDIAYASAKVPGEEFVAGKPSGTIIRL
jgi:hypothetical protein